MKDLLLSRLYAKHFVKKQLTANIKNCKLKIENLIVAYEPIWAIGTGRNDTPADASEMAQFIKMSLVIGHKFQVRVLYGGSVNSKNAKSFIKSSGIDGLLVGGASLKLKEFDKIIKSR